jgi:predicted extracellular nuclease
VDGGLAREVTAEPADHEIAVATYNVENLSANRTVGSPTPQAVFERHAEIIVHRLRSPDLLAIEEIQDDSGRTDDGLTSAAATWVRLIRAIQTAGGPRYQYRQIDPLNNADGGAPGANIRVGFLFRTDRGLQFVDRPGGNAMTAVEVVRMPSGLRLSLSPGRVDPEHRAWSVPQGTRRPLAGEFRMRGRTVFVIANHWKSKSEDQPLFGRFQPPMRVTEPQRVAQAQVVRAFVDRILAADPRADIIVLGDLNDFEFSAPLRVLKGRAGTPAALYALIETLGPAERYTYVFEGNAQALDHIMISHNLFAHFDFTYDVVHVNAEFPDQASDHDPQVVRLDLRGRAEPRPEQER